MLFFYLLFSFQSVLCPLPFISFLCFPFYYSFPIYLLPLFSFSFLSFLCYFLSVSACDRERLNYGMCDHSFSAIYSLFSCHFVPPTTRELILTPLPCDFRSKVRLYARFYQHFQVFDALSVDGTITVF